jgi:GAF domain-containing protein
VIVFVQRDVQASVLQVQADDLNDLARQLSSQITSQPGKMQAIIQEYNAPGKNAFVLQPDGAYAAHANPEKIGQDARNDLSIVDQVLAAPGTAITLEQERQLAGSAQPEDSDLTLVIVEDTTALFDSLGQLSRQVTFRLVFTLLIVALVSGVAVLAVLNPLTRLAGFADRLGAGELDTELDTTEFEGEIANLAQSLSSMAARVRQSFVVLEDRVAERTRDLELAAEVGRSISQKVTDQQQMLSEAVELIRSRFDLYYAQIYLLDPSGHTLTLQAGSGNIGRQMLKELHRLPIGSDSLNGRAVIEKRTTIAADTSSDPNYKSHALLPNTRSEMVAPIMVGDVVLGTLDIQSDQPGALSDANRPTFETLAGQVAIAIQNARLFAEAEEAHAEVEMQVSGITQQGWRGFLNAIERGEKIGYAFNQTEIIPINDGHLASTPTEGTVNMPVSVSGAQIGTLQIVDDANRSWTLREAEVLQAVATQLAQRVESLRLLAQAENYRTEAELALRRLTREGWEAFQEQAKETGISLVYDTNEVKPLSDLDKELESILGYDIKVRGEPIGELGIDQVETLSDENRGLVESVIEQLSAHIENLRLSIQTEQALATTQKLAQREQALRQITSAVRGSTDPATILRTAVRELGQLLGRKTLVRMLATGSDNQTTDSATPLSADRTQPGPVTDK